MGFYGGAPRLETIEDIEKVIQRRWRWPLKKRGAMLTRARQRLTVLSRAKKISREDYTRVRRRLFRAQSDVQRRLKQYVERQEADES